MNLTPREKDKLLIAMAAIVARRRAAWTPTAVRYERSFAALYQQHVSQADEGCDFDFLARGAPVADPAIY